MSMFSVGFFYACNYVNMAAFCFLLLSWFRNSDSRGKNSAVENSAFCKEQIV
jgi:hypothetical protein